jgi:hypothetical protein
VLGKVTFMNISSTDVLKPSPYIWFCLFHIFIREDCRLSNSIVPYEPTIHPRAIQRHCNYVYRRVGPHNRDENVVKHIPLPHRSSAMTPPTPPSLRRSSTAHLAAFFSGSYKNFIRWAIVDAVACLIKYYTDAFVNSMMRTN